MITTINNKHKKLNVPNLRFPEFQGEWEKKKLEECVEFLDGLRKPIKSEDRKSKQELYPYYGASGIIDYIDGYIFDGEYILLSEDGANIIDRKYRVAFVAKGKIWVNNHAHVLQPFDGFDLNFLSETLERLNYAVYNTGTTMPKLNQEVCRNINLKIPTTREQNKIGNLLSLLNERIATQNKIIEDLKKLKSAISENLFKKVKGDVVMLSEICEISKGKQINGEFLSEKGKYYVMNGGTEPSGYYNNYNVEANTISISEGGNSCGYVQFNTSPFWSGGHCYTIQEIADNVDNLYLYHFLKSKEDAIMKLRIGSGLPNIQKKDLAMFKIKIPTVEQQKAISTFLSSLERKAEIEERIQSAMQKEKQYLLRQMFI